MFNLDKNDLAQKIGVIEHARNTGKIKQDAFVFKIIATVRQFGSCSEKQYSFILDSWKRLGGDKAETPFKDTISCANNDFDSENLYKSANKRVRIYETALMAYECGEITYDMYRLKINELSNQGTAEFERARKSRQRRNF